MHYIRFLKPPRLTPATHKPKSSSTLTALITITTDLGDSHLLRPQSLLARVHTLSGRTIASTQLQWNPGMRCVPLELELPRSAERLELEVAAEGSNADDLTLDIVEPAVVTAWAHIPGTGTGNGEEEEDEGRYVKRRLTLGEGKVLAVWEEMGESIARHIWDGGLALAGYLARFYEAGRGVEGLGAVEEVLGKRGVRVLEIGTGCGIVGLTLSTLHPTSKTLLTDLLLASDLVHKNLSPLLSSSSSSSITFAPLDWDSPLPASTASQKFDLLLVADCMYNVDAAPALVATILRLMEISPDAVLLVAYKRRHEEEERFFEVMRESGLVSVGKGQVEVGLDVEEEVVVVEVGAYRLGA
ncbi:hypothetical protein EX30DRAFT_342416 [Ascodesmis nigricans]|uniref:Uncharacterized protein n=1 Tax=Ascodesmis nigricans TaxID=341454 RepID=A0A4S2MQF8_9PEZI|nr:hypothetical protein EX30DRAFT_342416 [Ascodesmis nigricans]